MVCDFAMNFRFENGHVILISMTFWFASIGVLLYGAAQIWREINIYQTSIKMANNKKRLYELKSRAGNIRQAIIEFDTKAETNGCPPNAHPEIFKAQRESLVCNLDNLQSQIAELETTEDN